MQDALRTYLGLAMGLTETSRKKVRKAVKDAVGRGNATAEQVKALTTDVLATNSANRDALVKLIKFEVDRALGVVGLATAEEVADLTNRLRALEGQLRSVEVNGTGPSPTEATAKANGAKARTKAAGSKATTKAATKAAKAAGTKATTTKAAGTKATGTKAATTKAAGTKATGTKATGTKATNKATGTKAATKRAGAKATTAKATPRKAATKASPRKAATKASPGKAAPRKTGPRKATARAAA